MGVRPVRHIAAAALVLAALGCSGNQTGSPAPGPELFGTWHLDRAATDSLAGHQRGRERNASVRRVAEVFTREVDIITLAAARSAVQIAYGNAPAVEVPTNGRPKKHSFQDFHDVQSKARWNHGRLDVEHRIGSVRVSETFQRVSARLMVTTRILGNSRPMVVRRLYR